MAQSKVINEQEISRQKLLIHFAIHHRSIQSLDLDLHLRRVLSKCKENVAVNALQECGLGVRVVCAFAAQRSVIVREAIDLGSFGVMAEAGYYDRAFAKHGMPCPLGLCPHGSVSLVVESYGELSPLVLHQFVVPKKLFGIFSK